MMHRTLRAALIAAVVVGLGQPAFAQGTPWEDRAFASISFGFEGGGAELSDARDFSIYGESARIISNTSFDPDSILDFSVGARVVRNFGVAIGYHTKSSTGVADIQGSIPHPIFFDRPRNFTSAEDGIDRDEHAVHLQFGWMLPLREKLDVFLFAGPSFYRLSQELVSDVTLAEQGPPFTSVVVQPNIELRKENATGYNAGADVTYMLKTTDSIRLGVGGFIRVTGATAKLALANGTVETDLGGLQFGIGGRIRF
ncbi:MAG: hypothetical protein R2712_29345 [Vicinamibacterales bacterium]